MDKKKYLILEVQINIIYDKKHTSYKDSDIILHEGGRINHSSGSKGEEQQAVDAMETE